MTVKTNTAKTTKAATVAAPAPTTAQKIHLTLGLYGRYSRGGVLYTKGTVYAFDSETAQTLLTEEDNGRPIWRVYKPAKVEDKDAGPAIVDMTAKKVVEPAGEAAVTEKGLEVGTDAELAELGLDKVDAEAKAEAAAPAPAAGDEGVAV